MSRLDALSRAAALLGCVLLYTPPVGLAPLGAGLSALPLRGVK